MKNIDSVIKRIERLTKSGIIIDIQNLTRLFSLLINNPGEEFINKLIEIGDVEGKYIQHILDKLEAAKSKS